MVPFSWDGPLPPFIFSSTASGVMGNSRSLTPDALSTALAMAARVEPWRLSHAPYAVGYGVGGMLHEDRLDVRYVGCDGHAVIEESGVLHDALLVDVAFGEGPADALCHGSLYLPLYDGGIDGQSRVLTNGVGEHRYLSRLLVYLDIRSLNNEDRRRFSERIAPSARIKRSGARQGEVIRGLGPRRRRRFPGVISI